LETAHKFAVPKKGLPVNHRPPEVATWIKYGRKKTIIVEDIMTFSTRWWQWWSGMQPPWRKKSGARLIGCDQYGDEWATLSISGPNGFLSVVATLRWWGDALSSSDEEFKKDWQEAVKDVVWIMTGLYPYISVDN